MSSASNGRPKSLRNAKQFSAGKFTVKCEADEYPLDCDIDWNGSLVMSVRHDELADLIHVLHRLHAYLRFHPALKGRWHEVD